MSRRSNRKLWGEFVRGGGQTKSTVDASRYTRTAPVKGLLLGVDPSLRGTGVSVLESDGKKCRIVHSEVFRFPPSWSHNDCLGEISRRMHDLLQNYHPTHASIENAIYVQNYRTALILGAARGAAIAAIALQKIPIFEYPPLRIKQALCGYGRASKEQIRKTLVQMVEGLSEEISLDESDATAVALCHWYTHREDTSMKKVSAGPTAS